MGGGRRLRVYETRLPRREFGRQRKDRIAYEHVKKEISSKDKGRGMTCIGRQRGEEEVHFKLIRSLETRKGVQANLPPRRTPYPLRRRLGGPRARLEGHGKSRVHRISTPKPSTP